MTNRTWLILPLLAVSLTAAAPRVSTHKWVVNFADAQCLAERDYGTADAPLRLVLKQPPLGDVIQLAVVQKKGAGAPVQYDGRVKFDDRPPLKLSVLKFEPKAAKVKTYLFNIPIKDFEHARVANIVSVSAPGMREEFKLSNVSSVMKIMDECVADLRNLFNIDPAGQRAMAGIKPPDGTLAGMFSPNDYPDDAIRRSQSGTVEVMILVDEKGSVADCAIVGSSASAALDGQTCAVMRARAKFRPAQGTDGRPTRGAFRQRITWRVQ
ncbi:MAG TPA: energy transducer TonB [Sphingomicrobium sp.]|nr:energy transducer TonB [Sphingomicrobium sp.]